MVILWKYLSVYRRELVLLSVLGILSAIANGSLPFVMGKFLDAILKSHTIFEGTIFAMPFWVFMLVIWGGVQMVAILTDWKNDRSAQNISGKIYGDYMVSAYSYILTLPLAFHKNARQGDIFSAFEKAGTGLESISGSIVIQLTPQFLSIIIGIGFALVMNINLAVILLLGVLVYVAVLVRMVPKAVPLQRRMLEAWGRGFSETHQAVSNITSVKQFSAEEFQRKKINQKFEQAIKLWSSITGIWSNISFSQRLIIVLTQLGVFVSSVYLIQAGEMTIGQLLAFKRLRHASFWTLCYFRAQLAVTSKWSCGFRAFRKDFVGETRELFTCGCSQEFEVSRGD